MKSYFFKRLGGIPLTLLLILLVNFLLINCLKMSPKQQSVNSRYLEASLRTHSYADELEEYYGLNLPLLINLWPFKKQSSVEADLKKTNLHLKNQAPYLIAQLYTLLQSGCTEKSLYPHLVYATMQKVVWKHSFQSKGLKSHQIQDLIFLEKCSKDPQPEALKSWIQQHNEVYALMPSKWEKIKIFYSETRLFHYFKNILHLNFGYVRADPNQSVPQTVFSHFKTSTLLLVGPLFLTFIFSQLLGLFMALKVQKGIDVLLTALCIILYALPIYIMIPLLIEKVGIPYGFPIHGGIKLTGLSFFERSTEVLKMLFLPYLALIYGSLALYTRFNKTLFLHVLNEPHLMVARAKGLSTFRILFVHTLRQTLVTLVPIFLGAIGSFLSGLILVENLFEIRGFGYLFYHAMIHQDYHVLLFSTLFASFISISGYFLADLFVYKFDPRMHSL